MERQARDRADALAQEVVVVSDHAGLCTGSVVVDLDELIARPTRQDGCELVHAKSAVGKLVVFTLKEGTRGEQRCAVVASRGGLASSAQHHQGDGPTSSLRPVSMSKEQRAVCSDDLVIAVKEGAQKGSLGLRLIPRRHQSVNASWLND